MKNPKNPLRERIIATFALLLLGLVIIGARVVYVDARYSETLIERRNRQSKRIITLPARRGSILDVNGNNLAMDLPCWSIYAVPRAISNKNQVAARLSRILGVDLGGLKKRLSKDLAFIWVKREVTDAEMERIKKMNQVGVGFIEEETRIYPNNTLAASIVGFMGGEEGADGAEKTYENWLRGEPGKIVLQKDAIGRNVPQTESERVDAKNGNDVYLTIDKVIQYTAETELRNAVEMYTARGGAAIVMEPKTGRILALASYPYYDPNKHGQYPLESYRNKGVSLVFEPGSTMKPLVAAAALDSGVALPHSPGMFCSGHLQVGKHTIGEAHGAHGQVDLTKIITESCNIGIAQIGMSMGGDLLHKYINLYGFGRKSKIGLGGDEPGLMPRNDNWKTNITQSTVSFGQGISVTPLQMAAAYSALANGGVLMKPGMLDRVVSSDGEVLFQFAPTKVRRVVSEKAAAEAREMLRLVVSEGTGANANIPRYSVGGKTGTAQIAAHGSYANKEYIGSFIGFAPVENPRLLVYVLLVAPHGQYYGGIVAAPAFQKIMMSSLLYLKTPPSKEVVKAESKAVAGKKD